MNLPAAAAALARWAGPGVRLGRATGQRPVGPISPAHRRTRPGAAFRRGRRRRGRLSCASSEGGSRGDTRSIQVELDDGEWVDLTLGCATNQRLVETRVELPLGLVMEEQDGSGIVVCEIAPGSNAGAASPKVKEGDRLLAVSAVIKTMVYPAANVMLGGIGRPSLKRVMLQTDKLPFAGCMDAIRSNSEFDNVATLVLQRDLADRASVAPQEQPQAEAPAPPVFDPRIFE